MGILYLLQYFFSNLFDIIPLYALIFFYLIYWQWIVIFLISYFQVYKKFEAFCMQLPIVHIWDFQEKHKATNRNVHTQPEYKLNRREGERERERERERE
jgi:hypothetical protein